ncbi:MAG: DNA alkylation repair protein [Bacteroidales bacterium]|nr:DNA alkylation repair protein [Bacteroidales bacterium]MBN2818646.1 DNA alkylation repair protein [Bacteroidales bacterium]
MEYLAPLKKSFEAAADPVRAEQMSNYMRNKFVFLGMATKTRQDIQKSFYKEYGWPDKSELFNIIFQLWELPEREYQMAAFSLLQKFEKTYDEEDIFHLEKLLITKSWWDTVDGLSAWSCGAYFSLYPEKLKPVIEKWMQSGNFWLQRACLLFQLKYKKKTDTGLLSELINQLKTEKEFFIRKAIGWILREYSKTNPEWVRNFIYTTQLSPLSKKEASKYI